MGIYQQKNVWFFVQAMSVLATPISACWTASKDEDTPSTGPTNAPSASKRITCGFSRRAVNVAPALPAKAAQIQIKITAASMRIAFAWKGEKSPNIPASREQAQLLGLALPVHRRVHHVLYVHGAYWVVLHVT